MAARTGSRIPAWAGVVVTGCQGRGPRSFEDFYVETVERTLAIACWLAGDPAVARDATQDAYLAMWKCWDQRGCQSLGDNRSYVVGIVAHKVADWYRDNGRFASIGDDDDWPTDEDGPEQVCDRMTLFKAVRRVLDSQPDRRRMAGILYFLEEFTYAEIAEIMNIAPSTVRTHVERLRAVLRPWLEEGGEQS